MTRWKTVIAWSKKIGRVRKWFEIGRVGSDLSCYE